MKLNEITKDEFKDRLKHGDLTEKFREVFKAGFDAGAYAYGSVSAGTATMDPYDAFEEWLEGKDDEIK